MIAIDTNVLLRYLLADDTRQHRLAVSVITSGNPVLLTDVVVVEALWTLAGKRYALGKPELCRVIRALIEDLSFTFEDSQAVWVALNDYENARPVRGKTLDFADALILHKAKRSVENRNMSFEGFFTFDQAARTLPGSRAPQ